MLTISSRSLFCRVGTASCVFIALSNLGMGASLYWDTDGTTAGLQGGSGTWNTTDVNWAPNSDGSGTRTAWVTGDNAHLEAAGAATITTSGTVSVNNIAFGASNVTIQGGDLTLANVNTVISSAASSTINAKLIGVTMGVDKLLDGILTLGGNNSYTGATSIQGGTLVINGAQSAATGNVTVSGAGTLSGIGTIGGNTTIVGIHAPGPIGGVGPQTFDKADSATADLHYNSGSIFEWQINSTNPTSQSRGTDYDAVNVTGTLSGADATFKVVVGDNTFNNSFWQTSRSWTDIFATTHTAWTGIFTSIQPVNTSGASISPAGYGSFSMSGNTLSWTAVPEPTSALAGLLILGGVLRRRRH